ncbi:MAG: TatD family hydrolase [Erysipelotrichaceae bacterium]|jgi:TatD DNase family protein|nr:TatD family hydrolase [Erysipelotrichaceae bacterium]
MAELHFVDSHAHILGQEYDRDRDEMIARAIEKHVDRIMIIALSYEEAEKAIAFAAGDTHRYTVAAGIFPDDAEKVTEESWQKFVKLVSQPQVQVIGEIGLDYHWQKDPQIRAKQRELFIRQVQLANSLQKPFAIHSRDAMQDTYDILKKYQGHGLLHCFSGTKEMAQEFTKLGYYLAFGGALTFKNARHSVEAVQATDEKWLLTETDSPYMAPEPVRGTRNEPSNIPYIAAKMAEVKGVSLEHMAQTIEANWDRFLGEDQ